MILLHISKKAAKRLARLINTIGNGEECDIRYKNRPLCFCMYELDERRIEFVNPSTTRDHVQVYIDYIKEVLGGRVRVEERN